MSNSIQWIGTNRKEIFDFLQNHKSSDDYFDTSIFSNFYINPFREEVTIIYDEGKTILSAKIYDYLIKDEVTNRIIVQPSHKIEIEISFLVDHELYESEEIQKVINDCENGTFANQLKAMIPINNININIKKHL